MINTNLLILKVHQLSPSLTFAEAAILVETHLSDALKAVVEDAIIQKRLGNEYFLKDITYDDTDLTTYEGYQALDLTATDDLLISTNLIPNIRVSDDLGERRVHPVRSLFQLDRSEAQGADFFTLRDRKVVFGFQAALSGSISLTITCFHVPSAADFPAQFQADVEQRMISLLSIKSSEKATKPQETK